MITWRTSSRSNGGNCVEVGWRTSSYSGGNGCVEVATRSSYCSDGSCIEIVSTFCTTGGCVAVSACSSGSCISAEHDHGFILVRDTKDRSREPIAIPVSSWVSTVLAPIMLDRLPSTVDERPDGYFVWSGHTVDGDEQEHVFTAEEWDKFCLGVKGDEFDLKALTSHGEVSDAAPR